MTGTKGLGPITCVVWSTKDYQVRSVLPCGDGKEIHGVSAVAFSDDGNYVAAALQDSLHSILVFAVSSGSLIAKTRGGPRKVLNLVFGKEKVIPLSVIFCCDDETYMRTFYYLIERRGKPTLANCVCWLSHIADGFKSLQDIAI